MRDGKTLWSAFLAGRNFANSVLSKRAPEETTLSHSRLDVKDAEDLSEFQEDVASERSLAQETWSLAGTSEVDASDVASWVSTDVPLSFGSFDDDDEDHGNNQTSPEFQAMVVAYARNRRASERPRGTEPSSLLSNNNGNGAMTWGMDVSECWPQFAVDRSPEDQDEVFAVEEGWAGLVVRPVRMPATPRIGRYRCSL